MKRAKELIAILVIPLILLMIIKLGFNITAIHIASKLIRLTVNTLIVVSSLYILLSLSLYLLYGGEDEDDSRDDEREDT